ncbi:MAG: (2Fe-2S)-binding protein [Chromatiales bacterium]|jgi:isoquinoline 1-oxidoreductase alpha subunit
MVKLKINGELRELDIDPDTPLLWAIRDGAALTGTKYGCGKALCGACTVYMDGQPTLSCVMPARAAQGREITTIEGLDTPTGHAIQTAWRKLEVVQCGYCQSGQIMAAAALLQRNPAPSDDEIDSAMAGNICRCATYQRIRAAIRDAAGSLAEEDRS